MKTFRFQPFTWPMLLLLSLAAIGCARPPAPASGTSPTKLSQEALLDSLGRRAEFWQSYQANIRLRAESAKGKFPLKAVVIARLPRQFRLEAFNLFGQTTGVLVLNQDTAALWVPADKTVYTAPSADALVRHLLGISLPVDILAYSLIGALPPRNLSTADIKPDTSRWQVMSKGLHQDSLYTWELTAPPDALRSLTARESGSVYTLTYDPPSGLALQRVPTRIQAVSSTWTLDITVDQILPQKALDDSAFSLRTPDGVKVVPLDHAS